AGTVSDTRKGAAVARVMAAGIVPAREDTGHGPPGETNGAPGPWTAGGAGGARGRGAPGRPPGALARGPRAARPGVTWFSRRRRFRILAVLVLLALVLRVWGLDWSPPGLDPDEVSIGYNAYSILRTGRDEYGVPWPLTFRAFGEFKRPAYIY